MLNRFDMGLAAGAGFRLLKGLGWTVGARYYMGFLDGLDASSASS